MHTQSKIFIHTKILNTKKSFIDILEGKNASWKRIILFTSFLPLLPVSLFPLCTNNVFSFLLFTGSHLLLGSGGGSSVGGGGGGSRDSGGSRHHHHHHHQTSSRSNGPSGRRKLNSMDMQVSRNNNKLFSFVNLFYFPHIKKECNKLRDN